MTFFSVDDDNDSIAETSHSDGADQDEYEGKQCPLCQEHFKNQDRLNEHALSVHSVNPEGLARLQSLINGSHWLANKQGKDNTQEEERSLRPSSADKGIDLIIKNIHCNDLFKASIINLLTATFWRLID